MAASVDPYAVLGLTAAASDAELRAAYRRLVKLHHPDHNGGAAAATVKFEQVQVAYAQVMQLRASGAGGHLDAPASGEASMEARIAAMEREIAARQQRERADAQRQAEQARRQAQAAATRAAAENQPHKPTREELGYVDTDDSFGSILDDALDEVATRWRNGDAKRKLRDLLDD